MKTCLVWTQETPLDVAIAEADVENLAVIKIVIKIVIQIVIVIKNCNCYKNCNCNKNCNCYKNCNEIKILVAVQ